MNVKIKLLGILKKVRGESELLINLNENSTIRDVISKISGESPMLKSMLLDPELNDPRPNAIILINGKEISVLKGLETGIGENDEITIIPVIHGGANAPLTKQMTIKINQHHLKEHLN